MDKLSDHWFHVISVFVLLMMIKDDPQKIYFFHLHKRPIFLLRIIIVLLQELYFHASFYETQYKNFNVRFT